MEITEKDYYKILGVPENANTETIKKDYKVLVKKYHPDNNPGDVEAEKKYKAIVEAYAVLSDPLKREKYDLSRSSTKKDDHNLANELFNDFLSFYKCFL